MKTIETEWKSWKSRMGTLSPELSDAFQAGILAAIKLLSSRTSDTLLRELAESPPSTDTPKPLRSPFSFGVGGQVSTTLGVENPGISIHKLWIEAVGETELDAINHVWSLMEMVCKSEDFCAHGATVTDVTGGGCADWSHIGEEISLARPGEARHGVAGHG